MHRSLLAALLLLGPVAGCALPRYDWVLGRQEAASINNSVFVPAQDFETVWEQTVSVIDDFRFPIRRENKLDGVIETEYKVGSGVFEPWHTDSVGLEARLESTLQSIRRRLFVNVTQADGGYVISVQAMQEIEDVTGVAANTAGAATFQEDRPLQRDLNLVVGQSRPSGWIPQGRDIRLEQAFLAELQQRFQ